MKKRFTIKTLGCKTNQIESATLEEKLIENGLIYSDTAEECDFFILNSCSVTDKADCKAISILKNIKQKNPSIKTVLTGCFAQLQSESLKSSEHIDYLVGNQEKMDIPEIIKKSVKDNVSDIFLYEKFRYEKLKNLKRTRASVKIQDGCNNVCSYCTIPLARGINRSNSVENIIEQIEILVSNNYQEVVLTGIHIGQWGSDFPHPQNLLNLIKEIEKTGIKRYRLSSLNPLELNDELVNHLAKSEKFCAHFHLSLQSACKKTLQDMNREYNFEMIQSLVNKINSKFSLPFIGSDIITGFPDESEEDFQTTYNNLKNLALSQIHVFPYSKRKNTKAYDMKNQISEKAKKERAEKLKQLSDSKFKDFLTKNINTQNEVIIEKNKDRKSGLLKGLTSNYLNILIDDNIQCKSELKKVIITGFSEKHNKLTGRFSD